MWYVLYMYEHPMYISHIHVYGYGIIVNLGRYGSKGYILVVLGYSEVTVLGEDRMQSFVHLSIMFWLYTALQYRSSMSSSLFVFHTAVGISSRPVAFLFLIFLNTTSSSCVNCPSLMSNWFLTISMIGSFITLVYFPTRFLKRSHYLMKTVLVIQLVMYLVEF